MGLLVGWANSSFPFLLFFLFLFLPPPRCCLVVSHTAMASPYLTSCTPRRRLGDWKGVSRHATPYRLKNHGTNQMIYSTNCNQAKVRHLFITLSVCALRCSFIL
uniref:Secreted protein n=1 Tax=Arundo donax TaxID=35708 RepID=A0A0A9H880_ARUDO